MAETRSADLSRQQRQLESLDGLARRFGTTLSQALGTNVTAGRRLETVLGAVGNALLRAGTRAAMRPLRSGLESLFQSAFGLGAPSELGRGGVLAGGRVTPFARGGVVATPTYFPLARGTGLMGEDGPEGVLPLARGPDGRLGVRAGNGPARPATITVNISTPDADSFRRSEAQVAAALARAVARGSRGL